MLPYHLPVRPAAMDIPGYWTGAAETVISLPNRLRHRKGRRCRTLLHRTAQSVGGDVAGELVGESAAGFGAVAVMLVS